MIEGIFKECSVPIKELDMFCEMNNQSVVVEQANFKYKGRRVRGGTVRGFRMKDYVKKVAVFDAINKVIIELK